MAKKSKQPSGGEDQKRDNPDDLLTQFMELFGPEVSRLLSGQEETVSEEKKELDLTENEVFEILDAEINESAKELEEDETPISREFLVEGTEKLETLKRRVSDLDDEQLNSYADKLEELCRRYYGRNKRHLSAEEKARLIAEFKEISASYGIAFPAVLLILLNVGSFIFSLIRFILFLRDRRRKNQQSASRPKIGSYIQEQEQPVVREGWLRDKLLNYFKTSILPSLVLGAADLLEKKKDLLVNILADTLREAIDSALTGLPDRLRRNYQELID